MKVGTLKPIQHGTKELLIGEVKTLQMQLKIKLIPNSLKASDNAPDYAIVTASSSGDEVQIGGAWKKTKEQIGDVTLEFLSITIDDPSLPNALNVAAFKNNDGNYDITWRRRQNNQNAAEECAA